MRSLLMSGSNRPNDSAGALYVDDMFRLSTHTGNGATQSINADFDCTKGKFSIHLKERTSPNDNIIVDSHRSMAKQLSYNVATDGSLSVTYDISGVKTLQSLTGVGNYTIPRGATAIDLVGKGGPGTNVSKKEHKFRYVAADDNIWYPVNNFNIYVEDVIQTSWGAQSPRRFVFSPQSLDISQLVFKDDLSSPRLATGRLGGTLTFTNGIDAYNVTAGTVERIQPGTQLSFRDGDPQPFGFVEVINFTMAFKPIVSSQEQLTIGLTTHPAAVNGSVVMRWQKKSTGEIFEVGGIQSPSGIIFPLTDSVTITHDITLGVSTTATVDGTTYTFPGGDGSSGQVVQNPGQSYIPPSVKDYSANVGTTVEFVYIGKDDTLDIWYWVRMANPIGVTSVNGVFPATLPDATVEIWGDTNISGATKVYSFVKSMPLTYHTSSAGSVSYKGSVSVGGLTNNNVTLVGTWSGGAAGEIDPGRPYMPPYTTTIGGAVSKTFSSTLKPNTQLEIITNATSAQTTDNNGVTGLSNSGFTVGNGSKVNTSLRRYIAKIFKVNRRFFDYFEYVGNGSSVQVLRHILECVPGMVWIKPVDTLGDWVVRHQFATGELKLNSSDIPSSGLTNIPGVSSSAINVAGSCNQNGIRYIAYLFANDSTVTSVIKCGGYTFGKQRVSNDLVGIGSIVIPSGITKVTLTGTGGPGTSVLVPAQPESGQWTYSRILHINKSNLGSPYFPTMIGFTDNKIYIPSYFSFDGVNRLLNQPWVGLNQIVNDRNMIRPPKWNDEYLDFHFVQVNFASSELMGSFNTESHNLWQNILSQYPNPFVDSDPNNSLGVSGSYGENNYQPAIPEHQQTTVGASTTASVSGITHTFPGGVGGAANQVVEIVTLPGDSSVTIQYNIPMGGALNVSYDVVTVGSSIPVDTPVTKVLTGSGTAAIPDGVDFIKVGGSQSAPGVLIPNGREKGKNFTTERSWVTLSYSSQYGYVQFYSTFKLYTDVEISTPSEEDATTIPPPITIYSSAEDLAAYATNNDHTIGSESFLPPSKLIPIKVYVGQVPNLANVATYIEGHSGEDIGWVATTQGYDASRLGKVYYHVEEARWYQPNTNRLITNHRIAKIVFHSNNKVYTLERGLGNGSLVTLVGAYVGFFNPTSISYCDYRSSSYEDAYSIGSPTTISIGGNTYSFPTNTSLVQNPPVAGADEGFGRTSETLSGNFAGRLNMVGSTLVNYNVPPGGYLILNYVEPGVNNSTSFIRQVTGSGSVTIPPGIGSVKLTGKGGTGTTTYDPGTPGTPGTWTEGRLELPSPKGSLVYTENNGFPIDHDVGSFMSGVVRSVNGVYPTNFNFEWLTDADLVDKGYAQTYLFNASFYGLTGEGSFMGQDYYAYTIEGGVNSSAKAPYSGGFNSVYMTVKSGGYNASAWPYCVDKPNAFVVQLRETAKPVKSADIPGTPPHYNYTTGGNTTATYNGTTYTFNGGVGGEATSSSQVVNIPGANGATIDYNVAPGGSLEISAGNSSLNSIEVGFEPQYVLLKKVSSVGDWIECDIQRGITADACTISLLNSTAKESLVKHVELTPTGFRLNFTDASSVNESFIWMAIARPNKPIVSGNQIYRAMSRPGNGLDSDVSIGNRPDVMILRNPDHQALTCRQVYNEVMKYGFVSTAKILPEVVLGYDLNDGVRLGIDGGTTNGSNGYANKSGNTYLLESFSRGRNVFDTVIHRGNGGVNVVKHGLGVKPEFWLTTGISSTENNKWTFGSTLLLPSEKVTHSPGNNYFKGKVDDSSVWNSAYPTDKLISFGNVDDVNKNSKDFLTMLFATLSGVSKVFSYLGDATAEKLVDCGFTTGARYILIIRLDSSGEIYTWNYVDGISTGFDPYMTIGRNSPPRSTNVIVPSNGGFKVTDVTDGNIQLNANGVKYIGIAIA